MRGGEGAEIVYPLRSSSILPSMILEAIGEKGQIKRKYYQRVLPEDPSKDYYYIMRETPNTTALLLEYGFIDNARDRQKLQNNLLDYVEAVVQAVSNYIGIDYTAPGSNSLNQNIYIVKSGDTLYNIAKQFDTTVGELIALNNLTNNFLSIGQELIIPSVQDPTTPNLDEYIVKNGDTLYNIAKQFDTTVDEIISYNQLPTTILSIGQILRIPQSKSTTTYTVKKGDTLYNIANNYNILVSDIINANNLTNNILSIGQELIIPEGNVIEQTDYVVYKVEPGDTLYSIARKYKTTPDQIKTYNNLNDNILTVNQTLQIPVSEVLTENISYTVKKGDTLYSIANSYGVPVNKIMELNNLSTTILQIGDIILIPF